MAREYAKLGKDYEKQRKFRITWMDGEWAPAATTRTFTQTARNTEQKVGTFCSPNTILEHEGGGKSGVGRTKNGYGYAFGCRDGS